MELLVVEDDPIIGKALKQGLEEAHFGCQWVKDGRRGLELARTQQFDVIVLDIMLPEMPGIEVLKTLRGEGNRTPVILVTALGSIEERVAGLNAGADDYMVKPFDLAELEARVRALCRRSAGTAPTIQCGSLVYDQIGRVAQIDGQTVDLSAREIGLLEVLLTRMGRLVSKDQLVDKLCGWGEEVSHNAIEVYVHRLRKKLEAGGVKIATVRGLGYCLERPQAE